MPKKSDADDFAADLIKGAMLAAGATDGLAISVRQDKNRERITPALALHVLHIVESSMANLHGVSAIMLYSIVERRKERMDEEDAKKKKPKRKKPAKKKGGGDA